MRSDAANQINLLITYSNEATVCIIRKWQQEREVKIGKKET